jgi:peroxiredoxin (alkyl hydroperoxide reductase subunit C)
MQARLCICFTAVLLGVLSTVAAAAPQGLKEHVYDPGTLKPVDSVLKVMEGDTAPDFELPSVSGERISLARYQGNKNVVISFVPAAWTPVCSDQWPGYNIAQELFASFDAVLIGITVDNIPTLHAWTRQMGGLWFPVLSDFWPHGEVADRYGVLRSDGTAERAIFVVDKSGTVRLAHVADINQRPKLEVIVHALEAIQK